MTTGLPVRGADRVQMRRRVAKAYRSQKTLREIAAAEGCSVKLVSSLLAEAGVEPRPRGRRPVA